MLTTRHFTIAVCGLILTLSNCAAASITSKEIVWTPTFYAQRPRLDIKHPVSLNFCLTHTPNILRTTISQIKKGVKAENGVYLKYISYQTTYHHGLGFNTVKAEVWTVNNKGQKTWHSPMWEYQQNLSDTGITNTVWATPQCKGKFIGISNQLNGHIKVFKHRENQ